LKKTDSWFGVDGRLIAEANPVLEAPMHALPMTQQDIENGQLEFSPPVLLPTDPELIGTTVTFMSQFRGVAILLQ